MTDIRLKKIKKSYGNFDVIHGVELNIEAGEFVVLVGPSGCGKSTLLRMIAGLEKISGGDLLIDGQRMNDVAPKDRDIAMVFQSYALYPHMTVEENMAFSLRLRKVRKAEKAEKVHKAAAVLGLEHLLARYPRELSGGQRQRVAMGRAIVRDPKIFLFDEPLSNLDAKLRTNTRAEIKGLHKRLQTTTVYVTHDQIEAMTMGDRIVVMNGGIVEQSGSPLELYDQPANLFVASFLGSPAMNFITGSYDQATHAFAVDDGSVLALRGTRWNHNGKAILGVRPEHLRIDAGGEPVRVETAEPTGSETHMRLLLGKQILIGAFRDRPEFQVGDTMPVAIKDNKAHLFDPQSTSRIPEVQGG
ncbi:ABC transporter ATP-binding protein [Brucella cytisi]|uniref:ABC transporter ATP-binding protein n=1 Tax=Brucella cytisi TaxID=407152 RepID=UPI0035D82195